jgi:hypothetical protein
MQDIVVKKLKYMSKSRFLPVNGTRQPVIGYQYATGICHKQSPKHLTH